MTQKARIVHLAGPNATTQNTPPLVTSNKARAKQGLPLLTNPDGSAARFDVLRAQRLAAPVTVYIEQFSAHPLEADVPELYGPAAANVFPARCSGDSNNLTPRAVVVSRAGRRQCRAPASTELELDVSTTLRHHPGEALLMAFAIGGLGGAAGLSPFVVGLYGSLNLSVHFFSHSNIGLPRELAVVLGCLVVTPVQHQASPIGFWCGQTEKGG